ncbi:NAD(P)-dependent oxidoreductase [Sphingobium tyrosinilyticum]|uniref:NAD(P)-dependent oxidoreductase n=1 Tax=Sphingobium tyrosinilyticum TaxID=2715436 RepID=A0ABV9F3J0_9SPHN
MIASRFDGGALSSNSLCRAVKKRGLQECSIMNIGWIGLGQIGTQMVKRLRRAGFAVTVHPRGRGRNDAESAGAAVTSDYRALAETSDALFLCVYDQSQLESVLFGEGALAAMRRDALLVVHTTASPAMLQRIAEAADDAGVTLLDACFSGGPADVEAGELTLMTGGSTEALERARPALESYAAHIEHVGGIGSGQLTKLFNNLLFATNLMNAAEMLQMGQAQGLSTDHLAAIIQRSSGGSYAMNLFARAGALSPDAMLADVRHYLEKDVASAMSAAKQAGINITAFAKTASYFARSTLD